MGLFFLNSHHLILIHPYMSNLQKTLRGAVLMPAIIGQSVDNIKSRGGGLISPRRVAPYDGQKDFFIQPMYDMDFMISTTDRISPVNKQ
jgi:hypothetical protein